MDPQLIEKFIEVTGESEATARQFLSLADGNVETAITLMFEGTQANESEHVNPEPEVRPPILPMQEVLVPPDPVCSFPRLTNSVFDRFRDFAVETQRQEEEMACRVAGVRQMSQRKSKRLEDLFRPPCNILFLGSFMEAREHAKSLNRWLLVNIQNPQEFACQILNRDVWSNQQIQEIIKDHFVLWQVLSSTSDGKHYIDFYNLSEYPYLAVIDPRTGECIQKYNHITVDILMSALNDMLSNHPSPECVSSDSGSARKWNNCISVTVKDNSTPSLTAQECNSSTRISRNLNDNLSDSTSQCSTVNAQSSSTSMNAFRVTNKRRRVDESDINNENEEKTEIDDKQMCEPKCDLETFKASNGSCVRLCLRLPSGKKETIFMPATNTIKDFINEMESMGYTSSDHTYSVPFPRTNIGALSPETHLSETILSPANTVFITKI